MPGRKFTAGTQYRYGFNGKENDNEVKGEGNQQDYGMRIYDPRLGKFLSVDPLMPDYPFYSPYQFAGNKPIVAADLDGLEEWMKTQENALKRQAQLKVQKAYQNKATVQPYNPGDRTWVQKWRDSKNMLVQIPYNMANGLYTLPQQLTSGLTQQEYIENIGGGSYRSKGSGSEKQRVENFVNGSTVFMPSAPGSQSVKGFGLVDDAIRFAANAGDDAGRALTNASVNDKLRRYLLNPDHAIGADKAKWFEKALGFNRANSDDLAKQIVFDPNTAVQTAISEHGTKFNQVIPITGANGKTIDVTFAWIKNKADEVVRLVTAIPAKK